MKGRNNKQKHTKKVLQALELPFKLPIHCRNCLHFNSVSLQFILLCRPCLLFTLNFLTGVMYFCLWRQLNSATCAGCYKVLKNFP